MEKDPLVSRVWAAYQQKYIEAKRQEWDEYRVKLSRWELDAYLRKY
jgi:glutamine synthetase